MSRDHSRRQLALAELDWPFQTALDANHRWLKLSECMPWEELAEAYSQGLCVTQGRPSKEARLVIGAVIIKHRLCLSDRETVAQIQENPYLQYFVGLPGEQMGAPFAPSLFVEIRKRMGQAVFDLFHAAVISALDSAREPSAKPIQQGSPKVHDEPPATSGAGPGEAAPQNQGKLILDARVAAQAIRFPPDLSLLNEARELSEHIIDKLYPHTGVTSKPRTYRQQARKAYLQVVKKKRPGGKRLRRGIKQQLQYLRRNLAHIERLLEGFPEATPLSLPRWLLHRYWVIQQVYEQQWAM